MRLGDRFGYLDALWTMPDGNETFKLQEPLPRCRSNRLYGLEQVEVMCAETVASFSRAAEQVTRRSADVRVLLTQMADSPFPKIYLHHPTNLEANTSES